MLTLILQMFGIIAIVTYVFYRVVKKMDGPAVSEKTRQRYQ